MNQIFNIKIHKKTELIFNDKISEIESLISEKHKYLIIDSKVYELYENFIKSLTNVISIYKIEASENNKSFEIYQDILNDLLKITATSKITIIAIGGGITTDLSGFVAATYKRGIELINIPTTLIGQIDAAVGSKNGVNVGMIKNAVGSYYEPSKIIICSEFLNTLDENQIICGKLEMIKIALMFNTKYLELISEKLTSLVLSKFAILKMKVVNKDRECKNIRNYLNFGHTLGHAIEISLNIPHGIAVGVGMLLITQKPEFQMLLASSYSTIKFDYKKYVEQVKQLDQNEIIKLLKNDKKNTSDLLTIVTMKKPGVGQLEQVSYQDILKNIF